MPERTGPAAALLLLLTICGCATRGPTEQPTGRVELLTSFQPLYSMAAAITRRSPRMVVTNIAPRRQGPHDYDPTRPQERAAFERAVRRADALVTLGRLPLAAQFDRLFERARRIKIRIIELDPLRPRGPSLIRAVEGQPNPHVWLSLANMALMTENLARDCCALDPINQLLYRRNAEAFKRALLTLKATATETFAGLSRVDVWVDGDGFDYLTSEMGLQRIGRGLRPEAILTSGVRLLIAEQDPGGVLRNRLARAGIRVVLLSTLERGWGEGVRLDPAGYLRGMRENLRRLHRALSAAYPDR